jgi:hypothetical protein
MVKLAVVRGMTVKFVDTAVTPAAAAVMVVVPGEIAVATPPAAIVATAGVDEDHWTRPVPFWMVPSL